MVRLSSEPAAAGCYPSSSDTRPQRSRSAPPENRRAFNNQDWVTLSEEGIKPLTRAGTKRPLEGETEGAPASKSRRLSFYTMDGLRQLSSLSKTAPVASPRSERSNRSPSPYSFESDIWVIRTSDENLPLRIEKSSVSNVCFFSIKGGEEEQFLANVADAHGVMMNSKIYRGLLEELERLHIDEEGNRVPIYVEIGRNNGFGRFAVFLYDDDIKASSISIDLALTFLYDKNHENIPSEHVSLEDKKLSVNTALAIEMKNIEQKEKFLINEREAKSGLIDIKSFVHRVEEIEETSYNTAIEIDRELKESGYSLFLKNLEKFPDSEKHFFHQNATGHTTFSAERFASLTGEQAPGSMRTNADASG